MSLNPGQEQALEGMHKFLKDGSKSFYLLSGPAGTGKTFLMQLLQEQVKGRLIFTAPTNKATKVLRTLLKTKDYTPECRTIYSLLGLRLEANGEVKELAAPEDPVDLTKYLAIVVDEASMLNSNLFRYIKQVAQEQDLQFIFLGDEFQLPPVKELRSPIWDAADIRSDLTEVRRHDNQILTQVTGIRDQIYHPAPQFKRLTGRDATGGVWELSGNRFYAKLHEAAVGGHFTKSEFMKAIAWRNVTVDDLNRRIRASIFENAASEFWLPGDRLILTEPAGSFSDDEKLGTTDDEGVVTDIHVERHPIYGEFVCRRLSLTMDDNRTVALWALHEESLLAYQRKVEDLGIAARAERRKWKDFWAFKESFHQVRHAYAITAHRSQGSTYDTAFVDWRDVLLNRTRREAFQCLYVASSRPRLNLVFN